MTTMLQRELEADPVAALCHIDLWDVAAELSLELTQLQRALGAVIESARIDESARRRLRVDPAASLREAGVPEEAIGPLLAAMKAPPAVAARRGDG